MLTYLIVIACNMVNGSCTVPLPDLPRNAYYQNACLAQDRTSVTKPAGACTINAKDMTVTAKGASPSYLIDLFVVQFNAPTTQ